MLKKVLFTATLVLVALMASQQAYATHNRAGELLYRLVGPLTYEVTIVTYTKFSGSSAAADRDSLIIDWGDGTQEFLVRTNGPIGPGGIPRGEVISDDIKKNEYVGTHTYNPPAPGAPFYIISMQDPNRIDDIENINYTASVNVPFFIEDTLRFYDIPSIGGNNSPELLNPPIDYANVNDTFYHNPNAWDVDGDSLYFTLIPPKETVIKDVPNYQYPNEIIPGPDNNFTIDNFTGEIVWATPKKEGIYNIAILVREYRQDILMGTLLRDMQIIVENNPNNPPNIVKIRDTCVIAGQPLAKTVIATDQDSGQLVSLSALGGPFQVDNSPATFDSIYSNPATGWFFWQTECEHIRQEHYTVVFKAEDNYKRATSLGTLVSRPLIDLETWLIQVIPPAPENLTATASPGQIDLNWDDPYACADIETFRGFSVWRKLGSNPFTPDDCETGLDGRGYTMIAENVLDYNYTDTDVVPGNEYCYRILAHFSKLSDNGLLEYDIVVSIPSNEACAKLKEDVPVITNVSVDVTDLSAGEMYVAWGKPKTSPGNLDTTVYTGPYRFELFREEGFPGSGSPTLIQTYTSPSFGGLSDTTFTDTGLNTEELPYSYRVDFYAQDTELVGSTETASSVYLSIGSSDRTLQLSWEYDVPWVNDSFVVYRFNPTTTSFDSIATVYEPIYTDFGLINDSLYCYVIESRGGYTAPGYIDPIINFSQEACARPIDTVPPCPPVLSVTNLCGVDDDRPWEDDDFVNELSWTPPPAECGYDVFKYFIYFGDDTAANYSLIDSVNAGDILLYLHQLTAEGNGLAGCYAVTAVDSARNESKFSNRICVDNCPYYDLPNVFTPNGDGQNELYTPFLPYRFVNTIEMKIYDRTGVLVFETTDPDILWDGTHYKTLKPLPEGVYFYSGFYFEDRIDGEKKRTLPPNENGGGFIHLIRDK